MQLPCSFLFRLLTLSFNLFLYIEELNWCCWEVWTLGETTVCHCWKEALEQCSQSDCELSFLQRWRCTVLPSASFVFEMFSLLQVFTSNTCSIRYIKPTLNIFPVNLKKKKKKKKSCKKKEIQPIMYLINKGFQLDIQKPQVLCTKETESENLKQVWCSLPHF